MRSLGHILAIFRRDFAGYFTTPSAISVGMLFLALSGWQFWLIVEALADPSAPAPFGALLESFFGGHPLFWGVLFVLIAALTMSCVSGERRNGNWELLNTSPATELSIVIGKWLACIAFYGVVWLPTLLFPIIVATLQPDNASIDLGPIVCAYVALCAIGTMGLAIGVCASTATEHPMIAAAATFGVLMALLFVGELEVMATVETIRLRHLLGSAARGELHLPSLLYCLSVALFSLVLARALAGKGRLHPKRTRARLLSALLTLCVAAQLTALATRHPASIDLSADQRNRLSESSVLLLSTIDAPVNIALVRPSFDSFTPLYEEAERLLRRMAKRSPRLHIDTFDPVDPRLALEELGARFATTREQLEEGGLVLFRSGERVELVELLDMAEFSADSTLGAGTVSQFRAERVFAAALAAVSVAEKTPLCAISGAYDTSTIRERLGPSYNWRDTPNIGQALQSHCKLIAVFGDIPALSGREITRLDRFLGDGHGLFWAAPEAPRAQRSALGDFIALHGIQVTDGVAIDPAGAVDLPLAWATLSGYGAHPAVAGFLNRRLTLWQAPRALRLSGPAQAWVQSSPSGWVERNAEELAANGRVSQSPEEVSEAVVVVASSEPESGGRIAVIGGAGSLTRLTDGTANALLATRAIQWLSGHKRPADIPERRFAPARLILSSGQERAVMLACVLLIPGAFGGLCALLWWRRRRG